MTAAKTCHASNTTQDLENAYCNHESFLNRDVSMFHSCNMKKLNRILKLKVVILNE